jgi:hypothetical protein
MEEYGKILLIAMPLLSDSPRKFTVLTKEKITFLWWTVFQYSSGITNAVKMYGLSITFISYGWMVSKIAIFSFGSQHHYLLSRLVIIDFYGYWTHRIAHIRSIFFWMLFIIGSEEFNLACALRQTVSSFINLFTFYLFLQLGVPTTVIVITLPIQLFCNLVSYQTY